MSLRDDMPVEPLSDQKWDEIEAAVFAELDSGLSAAPHSARSSRWGRYAAVAATAVVVAAAAVALFWTRADEEDVATRLSPTRVVSEEGRVETSVGDALARLAPHTAISVVGDEATGFVVMMEEGEATFLVPPRGSRPSFVVQAGPTRVEVVGTEFTVAYDPQTSVRVSEGVVRVSHEGEVSVLHAGDRWSSEPAPSIDEAEAAAEEPANEEPDEHVERPRFDARARFEEASRLEPSDPAAAIASYAEIAQRGGAWGEVALYAQASAELDRGRRDVARRLLQRYLRRHPRGDNAADARELLERLE